MPLFIGYYEGQAMDGLEAELIVLLKKRMRASFSSKNQERKKHLKRSELNAASQAKNQAISDEILDPDVLYEPEVSADPVDMIMTAIEERKECTICLEEEELTNFPTFSCGHNGACNTCIEALVESALKNSISALHELKCPEKGCKKPILFEELQQILPFNIKSLEAINELLYDQYIGKQEDIIYCLNQECRCPYVTQKRACKVTCIKCTTTFCEYCVANHSDLIPCFIARLLWGANKGWRDLGYLIENRFIVSCPNCGTYIEKNGGCSHMQCKCGHSFNWLNPLSSHYTIDDSSFDWEGGVS